MSNELKMAFGDVCDAGDVTAAAKEISAVLESRGELSQNHSDKLFQLACDPDKNAFVVDLVSKISGGIFEHDSVHQTIAQGARSGGNDALLDQLPLNAEDGEDDNFYVHEEESFGADEWADTPSINPLTFGN